MVSEMLSPSFKITSSFLVVWVIIGIERSSIDEFLASRYNPDSKKKSWDAV